MSTGLDLPKKTKVVPLSRFVELARLGEVVFHTGDLANLWGITNKNSLYTTIKRYVGHGLLCRIHKGFYAIKDPKNIDPLLLGVKALHNNAYVSTETILAQEGVTQQQLPVITLVSSVSRRFFVADNAYYSRKLVDIFLFQSSGITTSETGVRKATKERAIADLLYFNPHAYLDAAKFIDWEKVKVIQSAVGYPLTPKRYG